MGKGEGAVVSACMLEHSHGGAAARFMVRKQLAAHFMVRQLATHTFGGGSGEPRRRFLWGTIRGGRAVMSTCEHAIGAVGHGRAPRRCMRRYMRRNGGR